MTPESYDPSSSPLDVPVHVADFRCRAERPFALPPRAGATPGTLLNGLFELSLDDEHRKALLHRTLAWQPGRTLPALVRLSAPGLWDGATVSAFVLRVSFAGRRAVEPKSREVVDRALAAMGASGILVPAEGRVPFLIGQGETVRAGTLRAIAAGLPPPGRLLLELATPMLVAERVADERGDPRRLFQAGGEIDLAKLLGNLAYDLCCLDLEERDDSLDPPERKRTAERAREHAAAAAASVRIARCRLHPEDHGDRPSKRGHGSYPMRGFSGYAVLEGDLAPALPWLVALSVWRGGQGAGKGFGDVRVWGEAAG